MTMLKHSRQKPEAEQSAASVRLAAMNLLARREHSELELRRKLASRGFEPALIDAAIASLLADRLLDDARFTEAYIRYRRSRGYGPVRIRQELKERGVSDELLADFINERDALWREQVAEVHSKRFSGESPADYKERARQARFLQYRGFTHEQIQRVLQGNDWE
jgi:regulatory protein